MGPLVGQAEPRTPLLWSNQPRRSTRGAALVSTPILCSRSSSRKADANQATIGPHNRNTEENVMRKQIRKKLSLNKETLRNLTARERRGAVGGVTSPQVCSNTCEPTLQSDCYCFTDDCTGSGCPLTWGGHC